LCIEILFGAYELRNNRNLIALLTLALVVIFSVPGMASADRKVTHRANAVYPEIAKKMHVAGTVKLELQVTSAGKVKSVNVLGGHPMLADAAVQAAKGWQYEPASQETTEQVTINFNL
jgi:TonB family protein